MHLYKANPLREPLPTGRMLAQLFQSVIQYHPPMLFLSISLKRCFNSQAPNLQLLSAFQMYLFAKNKTKTIPPRATKLIYNLYYF